MESIFSNVTEGPQLELFTLIHQFDNDPFPMKVNMAPGVYRDENGLPWVLPVVRKTEKAMAFDESLNHEYLPVLGLSEFTTAATKLLLGDDSKAIQEQRAFGIQTVSGAGALRLACDFLVQQLGSEIIYLSDPTWMSHSKIALKAGFKEIRNYRYWNNVKRDLEFGALMEDLKNAPERSVIILHACAHNPTGCDPTKEQWMQIADIIKERKMIPLFDCAYQGFASGKLQEDAWSIKLFVERGFELFCAQSFSKNFGLYNERIGNLTIVVNNKEMAAGVKSQIMWNIRGMYSNPPQHGAKIVATILNNEDLCIEWKQCIEHMAKRVNDMRKALRNELEAIKTPGNWEHITRHIGMFSYTGLTSDQCEYLINHYHIYLLRSGRVNICGLNHKNVGYVAAAIKDAINRYPAK